MLLESHPVHSLAVVHTIYIDILATLNLDNSVRVI